eukprot:6728687-Alexandrium_andersonii.AAC.1
MCLLCKEHPRNGHAQFCSVLDCKKDYAAAKANAQRQGGEQLAAWEDACMNNPSVLRKLVQKFAEERPAKGRGSTRAPFDFQREFVQLVKTQE